MTPCHCHIHEGAEFPDADRAPELGPPDALAPADEAPDGRVYLTDPAGRITAHAALWWRATPELAGRRVGAVGGFAAPDAAAAARLLDTAATVLREHGRNLAVGPMHGNTWRRYRFVTETTGRGPFLLEPRNPPEYPQWWRAAGWEVLADYSSSLVSLADPPVVTADVGHRLAAAGVTTRPLDLRHFEAELRAIHRLSLLGFAHNFLYTPLPVEAFLAAYLKIRDRVDPAFVRIAECGGDPCGFLFGIADWEAAARGEPPALIAKSMAVDPAWRGRGLGSLLIGELHAAGAAAGFTEGIHALQYQTNLSLKITGRHAGRIFRRYQLYSKPL